MPDQFFDVVVIGAGIAGVSAAAELAAVGSVTIVEREDVAAYHSTGRSAALYTENYGVEVIRALTVASRPTLAAPPPAFSPESFLSDRGVLWLASQAQAHLLAPTLEEARQFAEARIVGEDEVRALCPLVRPGYAAGAVCEGEAKDIDVAALHLAYLRAFRQAGGTLLLGHEVTALSRKAGRWVVTTGQGTIACETVVNAAGAWADSVAGLAGVAPLGLTPMRRTVLTVDPEPDQDLRATPCVIDIEEAFYFKPDAARLLISPADQTPSPPTDAQADDYDVAVAIDRFEHAATLKVTRIVSRWAGLRTFAPDRTPVIGRDPAQPGLFWLAGQGGYGIMTAPAAAVATRSLLTTGRLDDALARHGVTAAAIAPGRLRRGAP